MTADDQEQVNAIVAALSAGKRDEPWPEHLQLRDALDELTRWLGDDHQWGAPRSASHWRSLIQDVVDALNDLGPSARTELAAEQAIAELDQCAAAFVSKSVVKDPALRERLSQCADDITKRTAAPNGLMAAWDDLVASAADRDVAVGAARAFLSLAMWIGHDADVVRQPRHSSTGRRGSDANGWRACLARNRHSSRGATQRRSRRGGR